MPLGVRALWIGHAKFPTDPVEIIISTPGLAKGYIIRTVRVAAAAKACQG